MFQIDNNTVSQYRKWLLTLNRLKDCEFVGEKGGKDRFRNAELEELRNYPKEKYVERGDGRRRRRVYRSGYEFNLTELTAHLINQRDRTIWVTNDTRYDTLLMLLDVDNKAGTGDADCAAAYLSCTYLDGRTHIEHSTYGLGRHLYFKLDTAVEGVTFYGENRDDIWSVFDELGARIKTDPEVARFGVSFDKQPFYGLPTRWDRVGSQHRVAQRGNLLRLPYLTHGLDALKALSPVSFDGLYTDWVAAKAASNRGFAPLRYTDSLCPSSGGGRGGNRAGAATIQDGFERRRLCVDHVLRLTDGEATLDAVVDEYHAHWHPTGMTAMDIAKRRRLLATALEHRRETYNPSNGHMHAFKRDQYLPLITNLITDASVFGGTGKRRTTLSHRRLSDFVGIKLQDAFFDKEEFGSTTRNATMNNSRAMKAKGIIDWIVSPNAYTKLLAIATTYALLKVYEEYRRPTADPLTGKVVKGKGRVIGPGDALPMLRNDWLRLYSARKTRLAARNTWSAVAA